MSDLFRIKVGEKWLKVDESIDNGFYNYRFTSKQDESTPFFRQDQAQEILRDFREANIQRQTF